MLLACGPAQEGKACTKLAQRISCAEVHLACVKRRELRKELVQRISCLGVVLAREQGGAHKIGTANFVLESAPLACGKSRGRLEVVLAREKGGAHEIGTENFVRRGAPGMCEEGGPGKGKGGRARNFHGEFRA